MPCLKSEKTKIIYPTYNFISTKKTLSLSLSLISHLIHSSLSAGSRGRTSIQNSQLDFNAIGEKGLQLGFEKKGLACSINLGIQEQGFDLRLMYYPLYLFCVSILYQSPYSIFVCFFLSLCLLCNFLLSICVFLFTVAIQSLKLILARWTWKLDFGVRYLFEA